MVETSSEDQFTIEKYPDFEEVVDLSNIKDVKFDKLRTLYNAIVKLENKTEKAYLTDFPKVLTQCDILSYNLWRNITILCENDKKEQHKAVEIIDPIHHNYYYVPQLHIFANKEGYAIDPSKIGYYVHTNMLNYTFLQAAHLNFVDRILEHEEVYRKIFDPSTCHLLDLYKEVTKEIENITAFQKYLADLGCPNRHQPINIARSTYTRLFNKYNATFMQNLKDSFFVLTVEINTKETELVYLNELQRSFPKCEFVGYHPSTNRIIAFKTLSKKITEAKTKHGIRSVKYVASQFKVYSPLEIPNAHPMTTLRSFLLELHRIYAEKIAYEIEMTFL